MQPSAFEKVIQEIARHKQDNGGTTTDDLLDAIIAANDDRREATADTDRRLLNLTERFEQHVSEKPLQVATDSILAHEQAALIDRVDLAAELAAYKVQVKAAIDAVAVDLEAYRGKDGGKRAAAPEKSKSADETEMEGDMQRAWRVGKWAVAAFGIFMIDIFARYVSHVLLGYPN